MALAMEIGRWANIKTARIYINSALLELSDMHFENGVVERHAVAFDQHLAKFNGTASR